MRFERTSFNDGDVVFESNFPNILGEVESVISGSEYQVKHCNQQGREDELIFDPVGTNKVLQERYVDNGWETNVNVETEAYEGGRDIDLYKGDIAGEIQFSHYTSLDSDMNRLQRLYEDRLQLEGNRDVQGGVVIVVAQDMPTSQSVSHFQQAITRAAPESLFSIPTLVYGIELPTNGETVIYNNYPKPRSRTIKSSREIDFSVVFPRDEDPQQGLSDFDE